MQLEGLASLSPLNDFHNVLLAKKVQEVIQELEVIKGAHLFTFPIADYSLVIPLLYTVSFCLSAPELTAFVQKWLISLFGPFFIFCMIKLIFGRLTCFDMKSIVP